jgi:hypothetical protein
VRIDLRAELHLLDDDVRRLLSRFLTPLVLLVLVLSEVHDPTHGRICVGCDLDEIEAGIAGDLECFGQRLGSKLRTVGSDQSDLASADAVVDAGVVCGQFITSFVSAADAKTTADPWEASTAAPNGLVRFSQRTWGEHPQPGGD